MAKNYSLLLAPFVFWASVQTNANLLVQSSSQPVLDAPEIIAEIKGVKEKTSIEYSFGYKSSKPDNHHKQYDRFSIEQNTRLELIFPYIQTPDKLYYWNISYSDTIFTYTDYLVEPGDSIVMNINLQSGIPEVNFKGVGWEKYQCRYELEKLSNHYDRIKKNHLRKASKDSTWEYTHFLEDMRVFKECHEKGYDILNKYKRGISLLAYETMLADFIGNDWLTVRYFWSIYSVRKYLTNDVVLQEFKNYFNFPHFNTESIGYYAPKYIDFLANYISLDYRMRYNKLSYFSDIFKYTKKTISGDNLERTLYAYFVLAGPGLPSESMVGWLSAEKRLKFLNEAASLAKNEEIKKAFLAMTNSLRPGLPAYSFAFQNPQGDTVKLSDYKGKVVIMDMWFTGCGQCAMLAESMEKELKPKLRDKPKVAFISISTDKDKKMWLKSVEKELYSKKDDINLFTNGEGFEHQITKHYGLVGLPFLLLIDKNGNIVRPGSRHNLEEFYLAVKKTMDE